MGAAPKLSTAEMEALLSKARTAGEKAFHDAIPRPMVVGTPKNAMASLTGGDDGGFDESQPTYFVSEGICGSGGVNVRPGNSRFARYLVSKGLARRDSYKGGVYMGCWQLCGNRGSQSYTRWCAAAEAIAKVLRDAGITAYSDTWVD